MERQFIKERIKDKIKEIKLFLEELSEIKPENIEEFKSNFEKKAACERYAEKIPEAIVDLALLAINYLNLESPEDDQNSFDILSAKKIIPMELANKLKDAKGMRNIIAHEYGKVDDEIVFEAISSELEKDSEEFITSITNSLDKKNGSRI